MKKELEEALQNVSVICANAQLVGGKGLTMDEHIVLSKNLELIRKEIVLAENSKEVKVDGDPKTDV